MTRAQAVMTGLGKGVAKALVMSALLLGPGMAMLVMGWRTAGMVAMFIGSATLMGMSYRKGWRLGVVSCLIPPVVSGFCYLVQLWLFGNLLPPIWAIGLVVLLGLGFGLMRGKGHQIYRDEKGSIMAKRTLGFILFWVLCYGGTQIFAYWQRALLLKGGLLTGAFSTAMLTGVSLVLLLRLISEKKKMTPPPMPGGAPAIAGVVLVLGLLLGMGGNVFGGTQAEMKAMIDDVISRSTLPVRGDRVVFTGGDVKEDYAERKFMVIRGRHTQSFLRKKQTTAGGSVVTVAIKEYGSAGECRRKGAMVIEQSANGREIQTDKRYGWVESSFWKHQGWNRSLGVGHASGVWGRSSAFSHLNMNMGGGGKAGDWMGLARIYTGKYMITVSVPYNPFATSTRRGTPPCGYWELGSSKELVAANWPRHDADAAAADTAMEVYQQMVAKGYVDPANDGVSAGLIGSTVGDVMDKIGGEPIDAADRQAVEERAAAAGAAVLVALTAAGVGAALAQSVAQAVAEAIRAGVELTAESVTEEMEQHLGTGSQTVQPDAAPLIDPYGNRVMEPNANGEYWNEEEGRWMSRSDAERYVAERRQAEALERQQREAQQGQFQRGTAEAMERSREAGRRRDAEFLRDLWRDRAGGRALDRFERMMDSAERMGMTELLDRADVNRVVDENGNVDGGYLQRVRTAMVGPLQREQSAPAHTLEGYTGQWVVEGGAQTVTDASQNLVTRIGLGWATGGSSEVVFQTWTAGSGMKDAAEKAADKGQEMTFGDGLRSGRDTLVRENLPVATWENYQRHQRGEKVSWGEIAIGLASDGMTTVGLGDDLRNVSQGLRGTGSALRNVANDVRGGAATWSRTRSQLREAWRASSNQASGSVFTSIRNRLPTGAQDVVDRTMRRGGAALEGAGRRAGAVADSVGLNASRRGRIWNTLTSDINELRRGGDPPPLRGGRLTPDEARGVRDSGEILPDTQGHIDGVNRDGLKGRAAAMEEAHARGRQVGRQRVQRLSDAVDELDNAKARGASPEELAAAQRRVREEALRVQADKHAMNELNGLPRDADGANRTIRGLNEEMDNIYFDTDRRMRNRLANEMTENRVRERLAQEQGISLDEARARDLDPSTRQRLEQEVGVVKPEDVEIVKITNEKGVPGQIDTRPPLRDQYGKGVAAGEGGRPGQGGHSGARDVAPAGRTQGEKWEPAAAKDVDGPGPSSGKKAGMDRDLTARVKVERQVPVMEGGRPVMRNGKPVMRTETTWMDVDNRVTQRIYNEELYQVAKGQDGLPPGGGSKGEGFINTHMTANSRLQDVMDVDDVDVFAGRLDQATTDRLHAEAYGAGQGDLDAATKDKFRGRDLLENKSTAKTIEFKVQHWMNEVDDLAGMAEMRARGAAKLQAQLDSGKLTGRNADLAQQKVTQLNRESATLMEQAAAHHEEGVRQLVKQYDNMGVSRTDAMRGANNASGATISRDLADKVNVLRQVGEGPGKISPARAEEILRKMGTDTKTVAGQLSAHVEGLQDLRGSRVERPSFVPKNVYRPGEGESDES